MNTNSNRITATVPSNTGRKIQSLLWKKGDRTSTSASPLHFQLDLSQSIPKPHKEIVIADITEVVGFEDPESLKELKNLLTQTNKAVTYFNSNYYQESFDCYSDVLKQVLVLTEDLYHKKMLTQAHIMSEMLPREFGAWTVRLALGSIIDKIHPGMHPLHACCTSMCGDPYVLIQLLCIDPKYRSIFPIERDQNDNMPMDIQLKTTDNTKSTPLHFACRLSNQQGFDMTLVHILLKAGADVNIMDATGTTPLEIALEEQNNSLCALLCSQPNLSTSPAEFALPTSLNFSSLNMNNFPERLTFLASKLELLDLSKNPIASIPNALSNLINLKTILLADMNLRAFPTALFPLTKLEKIDLSKNLIGFIPGQIECLQSLRTLKIRDNKLNSLPPQLARIPNLQKLAVERNPFESIPKEMLSRGTTTLLSYLNQMEGNENTWKRIKLLVLGEEATGKTSLLNCFNVKNKTKKMFSRRNTKTLSTDGLDINNWQPDSSVEFQTWDFAGQQVFYPTHQFFLSSRSIYIVTFNVVNLNASRPKYWIRQISAVTRDNPPIFLVGTHIDDPSCNEVVLSTVKNKMQNLINFKRHNIIDCLFISSKTGEGIKELTNHLINTAKEHHMLQQMVPGNFIVFDKLLSTERKKHQWVRWSMYLKWALQSGIDKNDLSIATKFLHDVGSLIYFDSTVALRDIVILDPQWLADIFSSLVTFNHQWIKDGILKTNDLAQIWKQYPPQLHPKLLTLLTKFGVASTFQQERTESSKIADTYIIPCLLNESKPDVAQDLWKSIPLDNEIEFGRLFSFNFSFEFSKVLIVLLHAKNLDVKTFWRYGIIVIDKNSPGVQRGIIQWLPNSSQLKFSVRMDKQEFTDTRQIQLLRQISELIDSIIEGFYGGSPYIKREVACSHCLNRSSSLIEGTYYFGLESLVETVSKGQWTVYCRGVPTRPVNIRFLAPDISFCDFPVIPKEKYEIIKQVGKGGFGIVYLARIAGIDVAVKEILLNVGDDLLSDPESDNMDLYLKFSEFQQEVYVMSALNHENLVRLYGVSIDPPRMIMEWCGKGDLFELLHPKHGGKPNIPWPLRYRIALDIAKGMSYLQGATPPIVHRDLRSPNIFLVSLDDTAPICAKVADFGLSRHVENFLGQTLPTWRWLAPEVIDFDSRKYDERSDIYSFAIVLWELATASNPYEEFENQMETSEIRRSIISGKIRPSIPDTVDRIFASLIRQCWRNDPRDRPNFLEIIKVLSGLSRFPTFFNTKTSEHEIILKEISLPQLNITTVATPKPLPGIVPSLFAKKENIRDVPVTSITAVGERMWCGFADGMINVYEKNIETPIASFSAFMDSEIFTMVHTAIDTVWIASRGVKIFDVKTFSKKKTMATKDVVMAMAIVHLANTETIWVGDFQGNLNVWNNLGSMAYHRIKINEPIYSLQQHGEKMWVGLYRKLLIYLAQPGTLYASGDVNQLRSLLAYGEEMWGALNDSSVFVWDTETIAINHSLEGHTGKINCIEAVGRNIWTGSFDTNILIWNPTQHRCIAELSGHHNGKILAIAEGKGYAWSASEDNILCVWKL